MAVGVGVGVDVGVGVGVDVAVAAGEAVGVACGGAGVRASGALQASARAARAHRAEIGRRIDQLSPEGGVCQYTDLIDCAANSIGIHQPRARLSSSVPHLASHHPPLRCPGCLPAPEAAPLELEARTSLDADEAWPVAQR